MSIHEKINAKANLSRLPWDMTAKPSDRERHAETIAYTRAMPRKIMTRNYSGTLDRFEGEQIKYPQDRKTNYREPRDPDGECFRGKEAQNYESEQMAKIQREIK